MINYPRLIFPMYNNPYMKMNRRVSAAGLEALVGSATKTQTA